MGTCWFYLYVCVLSWYSDVGTTLVLIHGCVHTYYLCNHYYVQAYTVCGSTRGTMWLLKIILANMAILPQNS
jgi:hypothetical protein